MTQLNEAIKAKDWNTARALLKNPAQIDKDTLSFALITGNTSFICDVIEAGALPNEDSFICAAINAPLLLNTILIMLRAENKDIKKNIVDKYGSFGTGLTSASEDEMRRVSRLEQGQFWRAVWKKSANPNFHSKEVKASLKELISSLDIRPGQSIFVPFCGKAIDMLWLQQQGYNVLGLDISKEAIDDFCNENSLQYKDFEDHKRNFIIRDVKVNTGSIRLICGDIFNLRSSDVTGITVIYDRAGYIALPKDLRVQYAKLITNLFPKGTKMLLGLFDFEGKTPFAGPPHFISKEEINESFSHSFEVYEFCEKRQEFFVTPPASSVNPQPVAQASKGEQAKFTTADPSKLSQTNLLLKGIISDSSKVSHQEKGNSERSLPQKDGRENLLVQQKSKL